jgi:uncharacterized protein (DUF2132 family)
MFGLFKNKPAAPSAKELKRLTGLAREDVKAKWIHYHKTIHLSPDVPLSQKIDFFVQPVHQFFESKYPLLLAGPTEIFWLTVFTAILESGTHPKEAVNAAIAELKSKYARS